VTLARQRLGRAAEGLVARRLAAAGWIVLERNARTRGGEIDLIALDGATLVFVEVKAVRAGRCAGPERPEHAVGPRKQRRLRGLAREWLSSPAAQQRVAGYRFDVVGVTYGADGTVAGYEHLRAAF
jgi:putative endonuclease